MLATARPSCLMFERTTVAVYGCRLIWRTADTVVDETTDEQKRCFSGCDHVKGRHFEHLL